MMAQDPNAKAGPTGGNLDGFVRRLGAKTPPCAARNEASLLVRIAMMALGWMAALGGCGGDANVRVGAGETPLPEPTRGSSTIGPGDDGGPNGQGLPCKVRQVLETKCGGCHQGEPKFGASTNFLSWEGLNKSDPHGSGKKVSQLLLERAKGSGAPMPPPPNAKLTSEELSVVEAWIKAGATRAEESCNGAGTTPVAAPKLECTPDIEMRPAAPAVVPPDAPLDYYICYGFDVTHAEKHHVMAMAPHPDNLHLIHHILLFESPTAYSRVPQRCDYADSARMKLVTGWAPGGQPTTFPSEAGYPQPAGTTHYVMQLHYHNSKGRPNQTDATGFDMCSTTKLRRYDAGTLAFGTVGSLSIPPRASKYEVECSYTLPSELAEVNFIFVSPHMHKLGRSSSTYVIPRGTGTPRKLVDVADFAFDSQAVYPATGKAVEGDVIKTRCGYTNPGDKTIGWGEGTDDEMCFNFVGYYPVAPDRTLFNLPIFNWVTPSVLSTCREVKP